ncbi:hypothetical protein [Kribbella pratensis]|uniref:DUF998 domain-containing protein n=1 Tax=Kribbella pratensis TaxID=2512112 RepID=A0A4V3GFT3_9ACTN|nr:hypothetical protein [Kribbella pratensis]TDW69457.1 hypothetical protein EV653_3481 [Kribbella pratensis]
MNRNLTIAGLVGAALTTVSGIIIEAVVKPASDVSDKMWSYPWTSHSLVPASLANAVLHLLVVLGTIAFLQVMTRRAGRVGGALATAGAVILFLAEFASLPIADQRLDETGPQLVGAFFGLGVALTGIGLTVAGIAVLRSPEWTGWQRYAALVAGIWSLVMIGVSATSALPVGVAIYGLTLCALFAAVLTQQPSSATEPRISARIES